MKMRHKIKFKIDPTDKLAIWKEKRKYRKVNSFKIKGWDPVLHDIIKDHDLFCTILNSYIRDERFIAIERFINEQWGLLKKRPFPEEGGILNEIVLKLRRRLICKGLKRNHDRRDPTAFLNTRWTRLIPHTLKNYLINKRKVSNE